MVPIVVTQMIGNLDNLITDKVKSVRYSKVPDGEVHQQNL